MAAGLVKAGVRVDRDRRFQQIDGFGVNINSKCWDEGRLAPALDLLIDDLGATLYRVDAYGKSDWIDPAGTLGPEALRKENLEAVYCGVDFESVKSMCNHLNARGIDPYLTLSGIVPKWMCAADGVTLADYDAFAEMVASYADWARREAGIRFFLLGPANETDIGPPEGPFIAPEGYVSVCEKIVARLDERGLGDIDLVVAEQAHRDLRYVDRFLADPKVMERVAVFGMHKYFDHRTSDVVKAVLGSQHAGRKVWMTEYGDLEQGGDAEWPVAWTIFRRLMEIIEDGASGALSWDAYDNYHDHDEQWTIYGLLRYARGVYTRKKRYYACRQMYRFVRPGFVRVAAACDCPGVHALGFISADGTDFTVVGRNERPEHVQLVIAGDGIDNRLSSRVDFHRTTAEDDCVKASTIYALGRNLAHGLEVEAPAGSIFTVTTVR